REVDPDPSLGVMAGMREFRLELIDVVEDDEATLVIGVAVHRGRDLPRRAQQQANTEPRLELLDALRCRCPCEPELFGRAAEAPELDDPGEETHRVQAIHADRAPLCLGRMNSVVIFEYLSVRNKQQ